VASTKVRMGNDEFILYIRKNFEHCPHSNDFLGRKIWEWLRDNPNAAASKVEPDRPCYWGDQGGFISENKLPKTATQFEFNAAILPDLIRFLGSMGGE